MNIRVALSKLASAEARQTAGRLLLYACAAGFLLTLTVMVATGVGVRRWFFALLAWTLFVYLPVRILLEAFQTIALGVHRHLVMEAAGQPDRYRNQSFVDLIVADLFEREVVMPRIAKPSQGAKAREVAVAVLLRASRKDGARLRETAIRSLAAVEMWIIDLADWSARLVPNNIQARWADLRALASLAALTKILIAAYQDQSGDAFATPGMDGTADGYLDACLDYCDQLALEVTVAPWTEPSLPLTVPRQQSDLLRQRWRTFCETASPAREAREAFVNAVTGDW